MPTISQSFRSGVRILGLGFLGWELGSIDTQGSGRRFHGFTAHVTAELRVDEIHRFAEGLKFINDNLFGAAVLQSMEDSITLSIKSNPNGALDVSGEVTDQQGVGNRLSFELHGFDQTHLSSWLSQLSAIELRFPVVGEP
jgi:hypothetical protein